MTGFIIMVALGVCWLDLYHRHKDLKCRQRKIVRLLRAMQKEDGEGTKL